MAEMIIFASGKGGVGRSAVCAHLAAALARLLDRPQERAEMGRRARALYEERFTGEVFARNTENIYLYILKGA